MYFHWVHGQWLPPFWPLRREDRWFHLSDGGGGRGHASLRSCSSASLQVPTSLCHLQSKTAQVLWDSALLCWRIISAPPSTPAANHWQWRRMPPIPQTGGRQGRQADSSAPAWDSAARSPSCQAASLNLPLRQRLLGLICGTRSSDE